MLIVTLFVPETKFYRKCCKDEKTEDDDYLPENEYEQDTRVPFIERNFNKYEEVSKTSFKSGPNMTYRTTQKVVLKPQS